jgi:hypothetical protein
MPGLLRNTFLHQTYLGDNVAASNSAASLIGRKKLKAGEG